MSEQVKCPICGRRLFDIEESSAGLIAIKCPQCKNVLQVRLDRQIRSAAKNNYMHTELKGV